MFRNLVLASAIMLSAGSTQAVDFGFGLQVNDEGRKSFYLAISDHYRVPEKEIIVVRERKIPDDEMPVVFFLARRTGASPSVIMDLRLSGESWMDITMHLGLDAGIYYVPVDFDPGPPYGKAYGHYKKHPKKEWGKIRLGDRDIVNFVNLRFICDHHGWSPKEVMSMRRDGRHFVQINRELKAKKAGKGKFADGDADDRGKSGKHKGNGKDKGKGKNK